MRLLLLILTSLSLLVSCGKPGSKSQSYKNLNPITPAQMAEVIKYQSIWCTDSDCPEGIGRMFAISTDKHRPSMACSAFLIRSDLVLTNSHCVYTGKEDLQETCSKLFFAFPDRTGSSHSGRCDRILWRDKNQHGAKKYRNGDNDFALVKLSQSLPVAPLRLTKGGMRAGMRVFPTVVDQINGYQARIVKLNCLVRGVSRKYGVATLDRCAIISGNSGSAVLDEQKNVVGIIFASSDVHVRASDEDLVTRKTAPSQGFAYTTEHLERILGNLLN